MNIPERYNNPTTPEDKLVAEGFRQILDSYTTTNEGNKKLTNYAIFTAYREVEKFNKIAGNLDNVTPESVSNQLSYVYEELVEGIDGYEVSANALDEISEDCSETLHNFKGELLTNEEAIKRGELEILDAACDLFVTVAGLMQKLESAGFDVATALKRVNANNMDKYIPVGKALHYNPSFTKTLNEEYQVYVLRDSDGKVRKHSNFQSVDIEDCVPEGFFQQAGFFEGGVV